MVNVIIFLKINSANFDKYVLNIERLPVLTLVKCLIKGQESESKA